MYGTLVVYDCDVSHKIDEKVFDVIYIYIYINSS